MPRRGPARGKHSVRLDEAEEQLVEEAAAAYPPTRRGPNMSAGIRSLLADARLVREGRAFPIREAGLAELDRLARPGEERGDTLRRLLQWAAQHHPPERTTPS